jgi:hypothetical protein
LFLSAALAQVSAFFNGRHGGDLSTHGRILVARFSRLPDPAIFDSPTCKHQKTPAIFTPWFTLKWLQKKSTAGLHFETLSF